MTSAQIFDPKRRVRQLHESARRHGEWAKKFARMQYWSGRERELRSALDARKEARRLREAQR